MLSESTARLVEHSAVLAEPDQFRIKGAGHPVAARRLLAVGEGFHRHAQTALVGRRWELAALEGMIDRSVSDQRVRCRCRWATRHRQEPTRSRDSCAREKP